MKKVLISTMLSIAMLFMANTTVYAGSCTSILNGPNNMGVATDYVGPSYSLASSYATATGARAKTYFYNLYSLSSNFASWNNRKVIITLMEKDGLFNGDDEVKVYTGGFTGRTMSSIVLSNTKISGNIESSGDHKSELYIRTYINKHSNDSGITRSFFDYQLCQE